MATNLVSQIAEALDPSIVSRIASALGLNHTSTQKAIVAAVPGLLAAIISLASRPNGANKLDATVSKQDPAALTQLANILGTPNQSSFIDKGASILGSLLGGSTESALASALGKYAGIGEGSSKSLLGLLGPAVLGMLKQEQRDRGLDASGLARLLTSQQDSVLHALPSGFSKYLDQAGLLDDVRGSAAKAVPSSAKPSLLPWLLGALLLLALGALLWRLLATPPDAQTPQPVQAEETYDDLLGKLRGVKVGDVDVGELANSAIAGLRTSLNSIKDEASAQTAVPELSKVDSQFDQLRGLAGQLSPETRKTLAEVVAIVRPSLDQLMDKVLEIPGVAALVKPAVDAIRSKLDVLAKV
jgi:hypothetical protein